MSVMIEVDPKLFITCRLCLQDTGQYQIVPKVRDQIKFCFDIEVEPFDGLPQLICKKCEGILSGFYETKTVYIKKQNDLKDQFSSKREMSVSHEEKAESPHQNGFEENNLVVEQPRRRIKKLRISSSSSESSTENNNNYESDTESWTLLYSKQFLCRFCKYVTGNQNDILSHVDICHKQLKKNHRNVFKKDCCIQLPRLEDKPNITGSNSTVVLGKGKIIKHVNMDYYILYKHNKDNDSVSDNSDNDDAHVIKKRKRKRSRLFSKSSTETVVVHRDENESLINDKPDKNEHQGKADAEVVNDSYECIKIDDSSDSDSDKGNGNDSAKKMSYTKLLQKHQETIQSIIAVCKKNVLKNNEDSSSQTKHKNKTHSANTESQLKHKFLSIGRKIVNKQGFNCTGLLRYMEHKNLDITWSPKTTVNQKNNSDFIRIMTKLKENIEEDNTGWKSLPTNQVVQNNKFFCTPTSSSAEITKLVDTNVECTTLKYILNNDTGNCSILSKNKLLNKYPVANPKQLPKKTNVTDNQLVMLTSTQSPSNNDPTVCIETAENTFMPIMTNVTSLAPTNNENSNNDQITDRNTTKVNMNTAVGRIKVKPVSELMSERVLHNIKEQTPVSNSKEAISDNMQYQFSLNYTTGLLTQNTLVPIQILQAPNTSKSNVPALKALVNNPDFVVMDTVELPNTRTSAPFQYLRNLLQIHNIILLDPKERLGADFMCLIKFKVQYQQEFKKQPVILCLSLFCYNNTFCIKVIDRNNENIDMRTVSANWQWEIIKIFTGETVNKLLQNAEKIGREVFEHTKSFCCLLASIKVSKNV